MSQFNPSELASYVKQETKTQGEYQKSETKAQKIPVDTIITHHGEALGELSTLSAGRRCDCPEGHLHSKERGENYAHTVLLSGGDIGISCSGNSCSGLFIPDVPPPQSVEKTKSLPPSLNIGQLDVGQLLHFTEKLIPEPMRQWTVDNCKNAEGSLNYGAVSCIIVCSNLIGFCCRVKPKRNGDWKITPNLWGMAIGNPSDRKSPVVEQFIKPLRQLESKAAEVYKEKKVEYESEKLQHDIAEKVKKKALESAYASGSESEITKAESLPVPLLEEPKPERFILNDATTESIGAIMSTNPRTLLAYRDEFAGLLATTHKSGREGDSAFYLESHKGDSSYTYDRIGRGVIHIEKLSLGLFGTIQPSVLAKYLIPKEGSGDGLVQRMQLSVFSDGIYRSYSDEPIDTEARDNAYGILEKLAYESFELMAGAHNDPYDDIPYFQFDTDAQKLFVKWYGDMKEKEKSEPDMNIQAHIGKYYGLLPSLALTFFLIDKVAEVTDVPSIEVGQVQLAIEWCTVLESHARMMYSLGEVSDKISLKYKIIDYVRKHQSMLPATFGEISGNIRGAKAGDVEEALADIAIFDGKKVISIGGV